MPRLLRHAFACAVLALAPVAARAQAYNDPLPFLPNGNFSAPLSVTTSSASVTLPSGDSVWIQNTGTSAAYFNLSPSSAWATSSNSYLPAGASIVVRRGPNSVLNAVTTSGTTTRAAET